MDTRTLEELLRELNRDDREKFEYLLNFYSREHVLYNFEHYKHALSDFKPFIHERFTSYVDDKVKELVSKIGLREIGFYTESFKTNYRNSNRKSVDDLLLYLATHTTQKEDTLFKIIRSLPKYKRMVENGWITESEILDIIKRSFAEEISVNMENDNTLNIEKVETRINDKIIRKTSEKTTRDDSFLVMSDMNESNPADSTFILSFDVAKRLEKKDIEEAFEKDGNIITTDISILVVKAILGKKLKTTDSSVIEQMKATLRSYDLRRITDEELDFLGNNIGSQIKDVFYLKNIASDPNALRAFSELPENLQEQVLKFNVVANGEDVRAVLSALDEVSIRREEQINSMRRTEPVPLRHVVRNISRLPNEKINEFLGQVKFDELDKYKTTVGIDPRITIGVEIEVTGFKFESMLELKKYNDLFNAIRQSRKIGTALVGWGFDYESSIENGSGLELKTPVMRDDEKSWKDLKGGCDFLRTLNSFPNDECGTHIHIGADYLGTNEKAWRNLLEIWKHAEGLIYKIGNPGSEENRSGTLEHAGPVAPVIDDLFEKNLVTINSTEDVKKLAEEYSKRYIPFKTYPGRAKSLNLQCIAEGKQNTIEFRVPNGSINPIEIQRAATLFAKIVEISRMMAEYEGYKEDIFENFKNETDPDKKILSFLDLVFDDIDTKAIFLDRYFGKGDKVLLGGHTYEDIISQKVESSKDMKFEWRGYR